MSFTLRPTYDESVSPEIGAKPPPLTSVEAVWVCDLIASVYVSPNDLPAPNGSTEPVVSRPLGT